MANLISKLFTPVRYGGFTFLPVAIIVYGLILLVFLIIFVSYAVNWLKHERETASLERELQEKLGARLLCSECSYCKKKMNYTFRRGSRYRNVLAGYVPAYCRKFKKPLNSYALYLRCIASDPRKAMREKER